MKRIIVLTLFILLSINSYCPFSDAYLINASIRYSIMIEEERREREFVLFSHHLGYKESNYNYKAINQINCMGIWQFHPKTLLRLGYDYVTPEAFKNDPDIFPESDQLDALKQLIQLNEIDLIPYMNYIGDTINGIKITKSGLLAGMHLGGIGAVKLFLLSDGLVNKADGNGTRISNYIEEFGIYNF